MKKFLDENIKKITIMVSILLIISIIVFIYLLLFNKPKIKEYSNNLYSISYDNSWNITKEESNNLTLKHGDNGLIKLSIIELEEEYKYDSIDTLIDEIIYGIGKQNTDYVLIGEESDYLTNDNIYGYKLLYEYKDSQVMVVIIKQSDKLLAFTYEANIDYFDILLDSALNVLNNIEFNKVNYKYKSKSENIKTTTLSLKGDTKVSSLKEYKISNNHYTVKYTIPSNLSITSFDSTLGYYRDLNSKYNIRINTSISNLNVYEEINNDYGILYDINTLKKLDSTKNLTYKVSNGSIKDSYIYYITYMHTFNDSKSKKEKVIMVIPLDKNHTFKVEINSDGIGISKELIDSIKIINKEKYNQDIDINLEGNNVVNDMKILDDNKYHVVTLYTPNKYTELDYENNKYSYRYFGIDYNEEKYSYNTIVSYQLRKYSKDIDSIKKEYSIYESVNVIYEGIKRFNNIDYELYTISYKSNNIIKYEKRVITKLDLFGYLDIKVTSNNNIDNNIFSELTNYKLVTKELN